MVVGLSVGQGRGEERDGVERERSAHKKNRKALRRCGKNPANSQQWELLGEKRESSVLCTSLGDSGQPELMVPQPYSLELLEL